MITTVLENPQNVTECAEMESLPELNNATMEPVLAASISYKGALLAKSNLPSPAQESQPIYARPHAAMAKGKEANNVMMAQRLMPAVMPAARLFKDGAVTLPTQKDFRLVNKFVEMD